MEKTTYTENQTFSFVRFKQLLASDISINKSKYLKIVLAVLGCFMTAAILITIFALDDINDLKERGLTRFIEISILDHQDYYQIFSFMLAAVVLTIAGSLTFSSMSSKKGRIATFMTPASMTEKFLLRFLVFCVGGFLLFLICYLIGLLEICLTFGKKEILFHMFNSSSLHDICVMLTVLCLPMLFSNSLYALGSSIWPRNSWVKTWIAQQVFGILMLFLGAFGFFSFTPRFLHWLSHLLNNIGYAENVIFWGYIAINIALIALCWALAWRRFRSTQITQRFMMR